MSLDLKPDAAAPPATTPEYETLLDLVKFRMSVRNLKPDPIPDEYVEKVLEVARWAMSGANSQPWEFVVVKDAGLRRQLYDTYMNENMEFIYWMERQRALELRHPAFQVPGVSDPHKELKIIQDKQNWYDAPVHVVVLGDGRRQWGTVQGAHTFGRDQSHLTDGLANTCMLMHLAAASLGLGTQWNTIHIQEPFKRILGVPDLLTLYLIIPIGYPAVEPMVGVRRDLDDIVHHDHYDMSKYMTNEQIIQYLYELRGKTIGQYRQSYVGDAQPKQ
jgi:nitroreductase